MGSKILITALASAVVFGSVNFSTAKELPVDPKGVSVVITEESGIGTSEAKVTGTITKEAISDWCENWRPEDNDCSSDMKNEIGTTYTASANCETGSMTDPGGRKLQFNGVNRRGDFDRYYLFENLETRKNLLFDNADNGAGAMAQWLTLCPYGLPYKILPMTDTINIFDEHKYNAVRQIEGVAYFETVQHNGRSFKLDYDLGTITYEDELSKTIPADRVLFRGSISIEDGLPTRGMAYVFKKGCEAQPYYVEGYYNENNGQLTLQGEAPVWDGCNVNAYTSKSKNAKLLFQFKDN